MEEEEKRMGFEDKEEVLFYGPGLTNQEMDAEFKRLYDSLIVYKNNIFHLVETLCKDCETGDRLALNIAERDSALLQRLVAKECEQRRMMRKAKKESVLEQLRAEGMKGLTVEDLLNARVDPLRDLPEMNRK